MKGELDWEKYEELAGKKLLPMNVQKLDDYHQYHKQSEWCGALLDCSNGSTCPMNWIDEEGKPQVVQFDRVEASGDQLIYYKFRSDEHEEAWNRSTLSSFTKNMFAKDMCYECVFRCTLINHDAFRELERI